MLFTTFLFSIYITIELRGRNANYGFQCRKECETNVTHPQSAFLLVRSNCESHCEVMMHDWRVTLTLVLHAWKSPAMFLRLAPTLVHDCLSLTIKPRWQRQVVPLQLLTSIGPVSMTELSEAKRLRGRGLGLGNGTLVLLMLLHSGN